jgi:hypothetical protein
MQNSDNTAATELLSAVDAARLAELLQAAGCRAEVREGQGQVEVHSAAQGLGFFLRLGQRDAEQRCVDFTWVCPLAVRGELPAGLVEQWNRNTRFARLTAQGQVLMLSMDTLLAGGVAETHLRAQLELWARLLQQLVLQLRETAAQRAQAA